MWFLLEVLENEGEGIHSQASTVKQITILNTEGHNI